MLDITIPKKRKCYATFDSYTGQVDMKFSYRGVSIDIEFTKQQWQQFKDDVNHIEFKDAHHGMC